MGLISVARESLGLLGESGCASVAASARAIDAIGKVHRHGFRKRRCEFVFTVHGKLGAWLGRHTLDLVHFLMKHGRKH